MSQAWCSQTPQAIRLAVQITPNAKRSEVIGVLDDVLKIRLQAPPVEGKANLALIRFIAATLGLPKSAVTLMHGQTSKRKLLEIHAPQLTLDALRQALLSE